jgi:hypothetical protein
VPKPKRSYIYAIHVDGVLRYIGKGSNGRMYSHMKEVKQRLTGISIPSLRLLRQIPPGALAHRD